jgi:hypothetical protein
VNSAKNTVTNISEAKVAYEPEKHDDFLEYERTLSYDERCRRVVDISAKGWDHNDVEHRHSHEMELADKGLAPEMKRLLERQR